MTPDQHGPLIPWATHAIQIQLQHLPYVGFSPGGVFFFFSALVVFFFFPRPPPFIFFPRRGGEKKKKNRVIEKGARFTCGRKSFSIRFRSQKGFLPGSSHDFLLPPTLLRAKS